jgi:hypothetical protein
MSSIGTKQARISAGLSAAKNEKIHQNHKS